VGDLLGQFVRGTKGLDGTILLRGRRNRFTNWGGISSGVTIKSPGCTIILHEP